jgi:hypothetical protein
MYDTITQHKQAALAIFINWAKTISDTEYFKDEIRHVNVMVTMQQILTQL